MNIENIKELALKLRKANYKDLFGALVINEKIDYIHELEDVTDKDIEYLEELYDKFMNCDDIVGLIDIERLEEL